MYSCQFFFLVAEGTARLESLIAGLVVECSTPVLTPKAAFYLLKKVTLEENALAYHAKVKEVYKMGPGPIFFFIECEFVKVTFLLVSLM